MAFVVADVRKNSIGSELGVRRGDILTHICGEPVVDNIDYLDLCAAERLTLTFCRKRRIIEAEVEKEPWEELGLEFQGGGFGKTRSCRNRCLFCFVDQLPPGMRETLYFKDDDWRMSFIMGNYITLTNVNEGEFQRILRRKTSPLYISVHATDAQVRSRILGNRRGGEIMPRLHRLAEAGIAFHCQAVVAPGVNDGGVLERTIGDLAALHPAALSLAVVPLGMTRFREGLAPLHPVDAPIARRMADSIAKWQEKCLAEMGTRFVFGADELYLKAELPLPPFESYEAFAQVEDGIGLLRLFEREGRDALADVEFSKYKDISIATGVDAAPFIRQIADAMERRLGLRIRVFPIVNEFFGSSITVTGLLTGQDIAAQLAGRPLGEGLILCDAMLRDGEGVFLDDMRVEQLAEKLGVKIILSGQGGEALVHTIAGIE